MSEIPQLLDAAKVEVYTDVEHRLLDSIEEYGAGIPDEEE